MLLNESRTPFFISKLNVVIRENINNNNNNNGEKNNRKGLRKISGQILFQRKNQPQKMNKSTYRKVYSDKSMFSRDTAE